MQVLKQRLLSGGLAACFTFAFLFSPAITVAEPKIQSVTNTTSIYGYDQYETAAKIAQNGWSGTSDYAILAAGMPRNLVDALAAGPLAAKLNAPIILTEGNSLNKYAIEELTRLKVKQVYITSGSAVIKQNVIDEVKTIATVTEVKSLGGYDASETSVNIAKEMAKQGVKFGKVVVTGGAGSDALSITPLAGAQGMPILYTSGSSLSDYVKTYLESIKATLTKTYVIGGTAVINETSKTQIPGTVERYFGQTQYDTNIEVLKQFAGLLKNKNTYIANGETLVDALAGAPLAVRNNSLILLTGKMLPEASKKFAQSNLSPNVIGLGGESVVSASVLDQLVPTETMSQDNSSKGSADAANLEQINGILKVTGNNVIVKNAKTDYSIFIQGDNVALNNVSVKGTIFLDPGDNGTANLQNVTATNIVILSGGQYSINLMNVIAQLLDNQSSSPDVHINATGGTKIERTETSASASLQVVNGSFGIIRLTYSAQSSGVAPVVELIGNFPDAIEAGGGVTVIAASGAKISNLAVATDNPYQTVTLKGAFNLVSVNSQAKVILGDNSIVTKMLTKVNADIFVPPTSSITQFDPGSTGAAPYGGGSVGGINSPPTGGGGGGVSFDTELKINDISSIPDANLDVNTNTLTFSFSNMTNNSGIVVSKDSKLSVNIPGVGNIGDFSYTTGINNSFLNTPLPTDPNLSDINFTAFINALTTLDATSKLQVLDAVNFTKLFALAKQGDQSTKYDVLNDINFKNLFSAVQSTDPDTRQRIIQNMTTIIDIAATDSNKSTFKDQLLTAMWGVLPDLNDDQGALLIPYMTSGTTTANLTQLFSDLNLTDVQKKNILRDIDYTTLFNAIMGLEPSTISSIFDAMNFTDLLKAVKDSDVETKTLIYSDVLNVVATMGRSNISQVDILNTILFGNNNKANIFKVLNNLDGDPSDAEVIMTATLTDVSDVSNTKTYTFHILP